MKRELKIWGERWLVRKDSTHAVSGLLIKAGYRCSWHVHETKFNIFVVLRGQIRLIISEMGKRVPVVLKAGESFVIKPGQWHEFQGVEDAIVIEEMFVKYDESDITREIVGGRVE